VTDLHHSDDTKRVNRKTVANACQNEGGVTAPMMITGSLVWLVYQWGTSDS
jgi:hypothetical protein